MSDAESFERHGEAPGIEGYDNYDAMIKGIQRKMDRIDLTAIATAAVICKTAATAQQLYESLEDSCQKKCTLMNEESADFQEGILITNSCLAKGLEFDYVIVPGVTAQEYHTERDRQLLYIAGTRALHKLDIMYYGSRSAFIDDAMK